MKSIVIYYSQSGNTKKIAQALQKGISRQTGQCDIARLKDIKPEDWTEYDLIGIGTPVWGSEPTPMYVDYIDSLPSTVKDKHAFFYCTHGVLPGRCIIKGVQPLQEKGLTVIGWNDWYCDCTLLPGHAKPWFTDGHPDGIDIAEAESFGTAMAAHSLKISRGITDIIPTLPSPEAVDEFYGYGIGHPSFFTDMEVEKPPAFAPGQFPKVTLKIDAEKCTGCGLCAEACFYNYIDASVTPPVFKNQECCGTGFPIYGTCAFCEGVCPTGAIEYDSAQPLTQGEAVTQGRQLMRNTADFAESRGRFRRLVPEEDMDWDISWEDAKECPRYKEIP